MLGQGRYLLGGGHRQAHRRLGVALIIQPVEDGRHQRAQARERHHQAAILRQGQRPAGVLWFISGRLQRKAGIPKQAAQDRQQVEAFALHLDIQRQVEPAVAGRLQLAVPIVRLHIGGFFGKVVAEVNQATRLAQPGDHLPPLIGAGQVGRPFEDRGRRTLGIRQQQRPVRQLQIGRHQLGLAQPLQGDHARWQPAHQRQLRLGIALDLESLAITVPLHPVAGLRDHLDTSIVKPHHRRTDFHPARQRCTVTKAQLTCGYLHGDLEPRHHIIQLALLDLMRRRQCLGQCRRLTQALTQPATHLGG